MTGNDNTRILTEMIAAVSPDVPAGELAQAVDADLRAWAEEHDGNPPRYTRSGLAETDNAMVTMTSDGMAASQGVEALNEALRNLAAGTAN